MKTRNYLLPYTYKKVGMWMFLPFAALCLCLLFDAGLPEIMVPWIAFGDKLFYTGDANLLTEVGMMGLLVSLCFIALSREKDEDESIKTDEMRLSRYGQNDHKRLFGLKADHLLVDAGFSVTVIKGEDYPDEILPVVGPADYDMNRLFCCRKSRLDRME